MIVTPIFQTNIGQGNSIIENKLRTDKYLQLTLVNNDVEHTPYVQEEQGLFSLFYSNEDWATAEDITEILVYQGILSKDISSIAYFFTSSLAHVKVVLNNIPAGACITSNFVESAVWGT